MKKTLMISALALALTMALNAQAATVTFSVVNTMTDLGAGPEPVWFAYATDSVGDNAGIYSVGAKLWGTNITTNSAAIGTGPKGSVKFSLSYISGIGFSNENYSIAAGYVTGLEAQQATLAAGQYLYGVGQTSGTFAGYFAPKLTSNIGGDADAATAVASLASNAYSGAYAVPFLWAFGQGTVTNVTNMNAGVFAVSGQGAGSNLLTATTVLAIPEPASLALLALGGVLLTFRSRKHN